MQISLHPFDPAIHRRTMSQAKDEMRWPRRGALSRLQVGQYDLHLRDPYAIFPAQINVHARARSTSPRRHVLGHRYADDARTSDIWS